MTRYMYQAMHFGKESHLHSPLSIGRMPVRPPSREFSCRQTLVTFSLVGEAFSLSNEENLVTNSQVIFGQDLPT